MKLLSLFSGIGAFEKALDRLGINYELVGFSEIDKYAVKSYCAIHDVPQSMNLGDINKIDEKALPKNIELITYGFPCQDISTAGKMKGLFNEDGTQTRSGLFFEALRIIEETQPMVAIAENVKNLTSKKFNAQFQVVLASLEAAGYNNYWKVLNAKDFGVPQNRERVFIVSIRKDIDTGFFRFPEGFTLELKFNDILEDDVQPKLFLNTETDTYKKYADKAMKKFLNQEVSYCIDAMYGKGGNAKQFVEKSRRQLAISFGYMIPPKEINIWKCQTSRYYKGFSNYNPENAVLDSGRLRMLSPKECFRLMDFDDSDFDKVAAVNSNTQLYKQAGNSIVVAVPYYIIKALIEANILIEKEIKQMELKMNDYQLPKKISFNYEELKQELTDKVSMYETLVYTDDQIKEAKADKANLNKLKKALNDERIRLEKEYMTPFNDFKTKINEIISIIDKPVAVIDKQVKEFEEKKKQDKLDEITNFFNSTLHPDWLHLSQIMNEKWLNASVSMKSVKDDIDARLNQIGNDLSTINSLPEFGFEAQEVYKSSLDINKALNEGRRLSEIQKKKAEYEATQAAKLAEQMAEAKKAEPQPQPAQECFMNPPVEEQKQEATISKMEQVQEPAKQWISFSALLTTDDALALKQFFNSRNIEFKAV